MHGATAIPMFEKVDGKGTGLLTTLQAKIEEYLSKGYIRLLNEEEINEKVPRHWYRRFFP